MNIKNKYTIIFISTVLFVSVIIFMNLFQPIYFEMKNDPLVQKQELISYNINSYINETKDIGLYFGTKEQVKSADEIIVKLSQKSILVNGKKFGPYLYMSEEFFNKFTIDEIAQYFHPNNGVGGFNKSGFTNWKIIIHTKTIKADVMASYSDSVTFQDD